jgi:hypothetical protein
MSVVQVLVLLLPAVELCLAADIDRVDGSGGEEANTSAWSVLATGLSLPGAAANDGNGADGRPGDDDFDDFGSGGSAYIMPMRGSPGDAAMLQLYLLQNFSSSPGAIWASSNPTPLLHLTSSSFGEWWTAVHAVIRHMRGVFTLSLRLRGGAPKKTVKQDVTGHGNKKGSVLGWNYRVWDDGDRVNVWRTRSERWPVWRLTNIYDDTSDLEACIRDQIRDRGSADPVKE